MDFTILAERFVDIIAINSLYPPCCRSRKDHFLIFNLKKMRCIDTCTMTQPLHLIPSQRDHVHTILVERFFLIFFKFFFSFPAYHKLSVFAACPMVGNIFLNLHHCLQFLPMIYGLSEVGVMNFKIQFIQYYC